MDIVVTMPKNQMANAAREAQDCIREGGGAYFRRLAPPHAHKPPVETGDRVFYVEDGYLRGFAVVRDVLCSERSCATTGTHWPSGWYVAMDAKTWKWIKPIPMIGFRGYRFLHYCMYLKQHLSEHIYVVGSWLDPRPAVEVGK